MICKTDKILAAWVNGDRIGALRIAARFFDRSVETRVFKRGMDAYNNPRFYRQLDKEPEQITQDALETLARQLITLIVGIAARIRLTAFVAPAVARHTFALAEGSITGQHQNALSGTTSPTRGIPTSPIR